MTISTTSRTRKLYVLMGILLIVGLALFHIRGQAPYFYGQLGFTLNKYRLLEIVGILIVALLLWRPTAFEFNDNDQIIIIKSKRIFLGFVLFKRTIQMEIPKRKIRRARIIRKNMRDYLTVTINGKQKIKRGRSIDVGLLTTQEKEDILTRLELISSHPQEETEYGQSIR